MLIKVLGALAALCAASVAAAPCLAADPPPVEDYGKLPAMDMVRLSPSGTRFAFVADVDGVRRIGVATTDNQPLLSFPIGTVKLRDLEWAGDDHLLVTTSATVKVSQINFGDSKRELEAVIAVNINTKKSISVFIDPSQQRVTPVVWDQYGTAQIAGHWYGYFSTFTYVMDTVGQTLKHDDDGHIFPDLYRVDLDTGEIAQAAAGERDTSGWLVSPSGAVVAHSLYDERYGDWKIMSGARAGAVLMAGKSDYTAVSVLGFGRTPDTVLFELGGDKNAQYMEAPLAGGAPKAVANSEGSIEPIFDPVNYLWVGQQNDDDQRDATVFASPDGARLRAVFQAFDGHLPRLISWSAGFNSVIVETEGDGDSGTYWFVDIAQQKAVQLGSAYPDIDTDFVGSVRMVDWKAADGLALRGVLTLPPGRAAKGLPLVVMPHGGPLDRDYPHFDYWAQAFAAHGYAVFQPNFRGSSGYGQAMREAGFGEWGGKMLTDISSGVAELARQGIVDPKRACIVGWSYGGYAAEAGVTVQHNLYKCSVSMAGVSDPAGLIAYADKIGEDNSSIRYWKDYMGVKSWTQSELNGISPLKLAAQADAPLLLLHGDDDTVVPVEQSKSLAAALQASGKTVELQVLPGGDHWLLEGGQRVAMVKASVAFVLKYNPPDPPPPAAVADAAAAQK